jgi:photosystem II stability/assembly factor-like uncharacterized protein
MNYLRLLILAFSFFFIVCSDGINTYGPINSSIIQWEQTNGPFGGAVNSIVVSKSGTIFLASYNGIYTSQDNGGNWRLSCLKNIYIQFLYISSSGIIVAASNYELYISGDEGSAWSKITIPPDYPPLSDIAYYKDGIIVLKTYSPIVLVSTNNGVIWKKSNIPNNGSIQSIVVNSKGIIFAGTEGEGIYFSDDQGENWEHLDVKSTGSIINYLYMGKNDVLYMCSGSRKLAKSNDNGNTWKIIKDNIAEYGVFCLLEKENGDLIFSSYDNIYISTDGGGVWNTGDFRMMNANKIIPGKNNVLFLSAYGAGIFRSPDNGFHWEEVNNGLINTNIISLLFDNKDNLYAVSDFVGVSRSSDNGDNWSKLKTQFTNSLIRWIYSDKKSNLFVSIDGDALYKSVDEGASWKRIQNIKFEGSNNIFSLKENSKGDLYAITYTGLLIRSSDGGENWDKINIPDTGIRLLGIYTMDNLIVVNGRPNGDIPYSQKKSDIFISYDNGIGWQTISSGLEEREFNNLTIDSRGYIFASGNSNLYRFQRAGLEKPNCTFNRLIFCIGY